MFTIVAFVAGMVGVIGFLLLKPYVDRSAKKWALWLAVVAWYIWTLCGISFVMINATFKHSGPATVGAFLFFIVSVAGAIVLARLLGLLNVRKNTSSVAES